MLTDRIEDLLQVHWGSSRRHLTLTLQRSFQAINCHHQPGLVRTTTGRIRLHHVTYTLDDLSSLCLSVLQIDHIGVVHRHGDFEDLIQFSKHCLEHLVDVADGLLSLISQLRHVEDDPHGIVTLQTMDEVVLVSPFLVVCGQQQRIQEGVVQTNAFFLGVLVVNGLEWLFTDVSCGNLHHTILVTEDFIELSGHFTEGLATDFTLLDTLLRTGFSSIGCLIRFSFGHRPTLITAGWATGIAAGGTGNDAVELPCQSDQCCDACGYQTPYRPRRCFYCIFVVRTTGRHGERFDTPLLQEVWHDRCALHSNRSGHHLLTMQLSDLTHQSSIRSIRLRYEGLIILRIFFIADEGIFHIGGQISVIHTTKDHLVKQIHTRFGITQPHVDMRHITPPAQCNRPAYCTPPSWYLGYHPGM